MLADAVGRHNGPTATWTNRGLPPQDALITAKAVLADAHFRIKLVSVSPECDDTVTVHDPFEA